MSGDDIPRMMWNSAGRPDRLTTPPVSKTMDHFNNNPYRNNSVSQQHSVPHKVQQSSDPWNWGWEDNGSSGGQGSGGQDENDLWGAQPTAHLHQPLQQQQHQHQVNTNNTSIPSNSSDFFESIDLNSSVNTANKLFNQQPPQPQYHYSHQPPQQQHFPQQQIQPQPQVSANPSYSYFQFTEHQQNPTVNSVPLVNQCSSTASSQPHSTYTNHTISNFPQQQLPQSQLQFTHMNNYQFATSTPFSPHTVYNSSSSNNVNSNSINNNNIAAEVENREIAPPEKIDKNLNLNQTLASSTPPPPLVSSVSTTSVNSNGSKSNIVPENQETVPENEERPPDPNTISSSMNNLRLSSPPPSELSAGIAASSNDLQQWNSVPGWENQEVAPRFTVDRDQYLETGHLHPPSTGQSQSHQSSTTDNDVDVDTNDEGEAVPPPGLHRLVTGQGQTVGQERLVVGSPPPPTSSSLGPTGQRPQVPGHSMQQQSDLSAHPSHPPLGQRMIPGQLRDDDMERMVLGSSNSTNENVNNIQQPREQLQSNSVSQRTVPGGRSSDIQQSRDRDQTPGDHVSQRTVPGGSSTSSSSAGSNSSYSQLPDLPPEERLVLGRPTIDQGDDRLQPQQNTSVHNVITSSPPSMWTSGLGNSNHQDSVANHQVSYTGDSDLSSQPPPRPPSNSNSIVGAAEQSRSNSLVSDPPPGLHRMVVGHRDNSSRGGSASGDEVSQIGVPPPGLHRMVLGEQKQLQPDQNQPQLGMPPQQMQQQSQSLSQGSNADNEECDKDRDIDSDSDYRISRRKHNHRRDYDHSPEYRSEEDIDRERSDYRDHYRHPPRPRPRDRDRERERGDRRRHSPDYYYRDDDYRDDQRRHGRGGRYYPPRDVYEDDYYYYHRENRSSRPSSRSGREYPRRPGGTGGPHEYIPPRNIHPYYQDQGNYCFMVEDSRSQSLSLPGTPSIQSIDYQSAMQQQMHYYQWQQQIYEMRRTDPKGYAAWYERYMMDVNNKLYSQGLHHPNDRTSVLSGRSSANHHRSSNEKVPMDDTISSISTKGMHDASGISIAGPHGSVDHRLTSEEDAGDAGDNNSISQRYTPQLYGRGAHVRGSWSKQGQLIVVSPNYPQDGQLPIVEITQPVLPNFQNDPDILEFLESPGPFIVGVTHKNSVLQYLKKMADQASHNAEKLLYEYMQLVIRLNGMVDMTDVADLLMSNYNEDPGAEHDQYHQTQLQQQQYGDSIGQQDSSVNSEASAEEVTDRFRDLLLQGNKLEALEWAIQNKNWGHAFFLASKMDTRSYNNVMLRFANGLPANDPLQTLYQMMSGREPQAATCCADKKWGDWRPHLAMMLSNTSGHPEIDRKAIITLGDSLASKGRLFASHFCYVTAQVDFGAYTDRSAKLVLLGSSHALPFAQFATCRSIMLTLCYEYSKRLHKKDLCIPALQIYKYILATRLIDNGKLVIASQYLEKIALDMIHRPTRQNRPLAILVAELADQIKLADPALAVVGDPNDDPDWLNMLKQILDDTDTNLQTSSMSHGISTSTVSTSAADAPPIPNQVAGYGQDQVIYDNSLHAWNQPESQSLDTTHCTGYQNNINHEVIEDPYNQYQQQPPSQIQLQQPHETQYQQQMPIPDAGAPFGSNDYTANAQQLQNSNAVVWNPMDNIYSSNWQDQSQVQQQPPIMVAPIGTQVSSASNTMNATNLAQAQKIPSPEKKPNKDESSRRSGKKSKQQSSGWFGGIFDKITFRSKNEMILPDDKNPSIVWDEKIGRWVDKNSDGDDEVTALKPPPKASELPGFSNPPPLAPVPMPVSAPIPSPAYENPVSSTAAPSTTNANVPAGNGPMPTIPGVNKLRMQRVKGMKANYVDVMNPNSSKKASAPVAVPPPMMEPVPAATAPINNFFIPAPVEGNENAPIDFVSPSGPVSYESSHKPLDQTKELSRSSSASSLSREVSYIMSRNRKQPQSKPYKQLNRHQKNQLQAGMNYSSQESYYNVMQGK